MENKTEDEIYESCINEGITNIKEKVKRILTQTNYDINTAIEKLKIFKYDEILVIKDYMGIDNNVNNKKLNNMSTQQKIYKSIREFF